MSICELLASDVEGSVRFAMALQPYKCEEWLGKCKAKCKKQSKLLKTEVMAEREGFNLLGESQPNGDMPVSVFSPMFLRV
jgi:hypothetical protein